MLNGLGKKQILAAAVVMLSLAGSACASLSSRINGVISRKEFSKAHFAIQILDADTCKTLYQRNANTPMIPASNMKIITSAAALHYLGADYEYTTKIAMLDDDLVVIGGGDPLFGDKEMNKKYNRQNGWIFDDIIKNLRASGIRKIDNIIIDSTFFDDNRVHPSWPRDQLNQSYVCEISGLNFNNNCVDFKISRSGNRVSVTFEPATSYVTVVNQVKAASSGSSAAGAYRTNIPNKLILRGKCVKSTGFDTAIERPALFFGTVLREKLTAAQIKVSGTVSEKYVKKDPAIRTLQIYKTSMSDVFERCNKDSLNMAAESLVKTISAENTMGSINGEWNHGFVLIGRYLTSLGIEPGQLTLDDACGLSRKNRVSPAAMATVLCDMYESKNWDFFRKSLSIGGVDGTTRKYFTESKYKGKVLGKTGYIDGVRAFSGVVNTDNGNYIFSILTSGGSSSVRTGINDIVKAIIDSAE